MLFSSLLFIFIFLPVAVCTYYIAPRKFRNLILLCFSLVFYAWGEPVNIIIMLFSIVFDYINGRLIYKNINNKKRAKTILIFSITVNLLLLGFFKYYAFFFSSILNQVFNINVPVIKMTLPLGISFYTFQTMSYVIDVYKGVVPAQDSFINFATYLTMFPQLLAGPIVKYRDVFKELTERKEKIQLFSEGIELFVIGLFKKVVIANNIGDIWSMVKGMEFGQVSVALSWLGIISFTFQIYFDFSGYSDMARGLGMIFGFHLPENFRYPYTAKSITEFWRRWHITLGGFFREYVYIPLGGNRTTKLKYYRNIFVVWGLTGLWHGANWNFILWGLYYGIIISMEKMFLLKYLDKVPYLVRNLYSMSLIIIGWVFFEFEDISKLIKFLKILFGVGAKSIIDNSAIYYGYSNAMIIIIMLLAITPACNMIVNKIKEKQSLASTTVLIITYSFMFFVSIAYLVNQNFNPFLYFRF